MFFMRNQHTGTGGDAATVPAASFARTGDVTVYSGVKFDADGDVYARSALGGWQQVGTWLLNGTNSDFSVARTINSGSLTTDAGAGDLQLNSDRSFDIQNSTPSSESTATVTFVISNWNAGSPNVTYSTRAYTFTATAESP